VIYLDYNASTPTDLRVLDAMWPFFATRHGNASSTDHAVGAQARRAVETARGQVAELIGADEEEIVFTSGATEADNIAILGTLARLDGAAQVLVSPVEHPAVLEPARTAGSRLRMIPVDGDGIVDVDALRALLSAPTGLVAIMAANNETGAVQPLREITRLCQDAEVPLHIDAAQAVARIPMDVGNDPCATLALSGHKMYGPQGVGALYVRRRRPRARVSPILFGGGHERNLRPGTMNLPGIVGIGEAARLVGRERENDADRESQLRIRLLERLSEAPVPLHQNLTDAPRLPQTVSMRFEGVRAAAVMHQLSNEVAISTGSACSTTSVEPSHVLVAQGLSHEAIKETMRVSFGRNTSDEDIEVAATLIIAAVTSVVAVGRASQPA
jgi:cysteine desulfurase